MTKVTSEGNSLAKVSPKLPIGLFAYILEEQLFFLYIKHKLNFLEFRNICIYLKCVRLGAIFVGIFLYAKKCFTEKYDRSLIKS